MNLIDWLVLKRLGSRVLVMVLLIFGIIVLAESLNTARVRFLMDVGGAPLAGSAMLAAAARWTVRTISVTVLVGTIIGILDLKARQEFNVIKASGRSIWSAMRAPVAATFVLGLVVALYVDSEVTRLDRSLNPTEAGDRGAVTPDGALWLEQDSEQGRYVLRAARVLPGGTALDDATFFLIGDFEFERIQASEVRLGIGAWHIVSGVGFSLNRAREVVTDYRVPTYSSGSEIELRLASTQDLTVFDLAGLFASGIQDPSLQAVVATRLLRLLTLPALLVGSVVLAFAFTSGYRRTNKYGAAVLYGIVLGFVVFFITELADRAGSAGALDPTFAAVGPAFVALVVGVTVLLYREDGRA